MLKLLRFQPYRYEIWYAPNTLDFKFSLFANEICDSENDAFYSSRQLLEKEEYRETLKIEKWNKLLGWRVGEYIYSKTNNNFIYYPTPVTFMQLVSDRVSLALDIAKITFFFRLWSFKRWLSSPLRFLIGVAIIIYLFVVAPLETLLKAGNREEFNKEIDDFLDSIKTPTLYTSIFIYAFIIYQIIKLLCNH